MHETRSHRLRIRVRIGNGCGTTCQLAVTAQGDIYVADTLNWRVQKYVKK